MKVDDSMLSANNTVRSGGGIQGLFELDKQSSSRRKALFLDLYPERFDDHQIGSVNFNLEESLKRESKVQHSKSHRAQLEHKGEKNTI